MKTIIFFSAILSLLILESCNDVTLTPDTEVETEGKAKAEALLLKTSWRDTLYYLIMPPLEPDWIFFYKDGSIFINRQGKTGRGTWTVNYNGTELRTQVRYNGTLTTENYDLSYIDTKRVNGGDSLKLVLTPKFQSSEKRYVYLPENGYIRKGAVRTSSIENPTGLTIPTNAKIYVIWDVIKGNSTQYSYIWGKNENVNWNNPNAIFLEFDSDEPPAATLNKFNEDDEIAVGRMVITTEILTEGKTSLFFKPQNYLGGLNNQAVVYRKGVFQSGYLSWGSGFPFDFVIANFTYNTAEGVDMFDYTYTPGILEMDANASQNFKIPAWYK